MRVCEIEGCGRKHAAKGLCKLHYSRKRAGRHMGDASDCGFTWYGTGVCSRPSFALGLCWEHYRMACDERLDEDYIEAYAKLPTGDSPGPEYKLTIRKLVLALVVLVLLVLGFWSVGHNPPHYMNCLEAPGMLHEGGPGYRTPLDADHDGLACE